MRLLIIVALFVCLFGLVRGEPRHLRGIKRSEQSKYTGATFTCFDQSATIPSNQVNDDYCDCADGSDEPGTSACLTSTFYCANKLSSPLTLPSSRVNDMICDCCDGSDEWMNLSGTPCPNTCEEEGRARHAAVLQEIEATEQGLKVRAEMVERAQQIKREKETQKAALEAKLAERRTALDQARAAQAVEEEKEKAERDRLQAIEDAKHAVDPEFQRLAEEAAQRASAETEAVKVDETEHVVASETAPAAESDSAAFPYPAEYAYKPAEPEQVVHQEVESFPYPQEYAYQAGNGEEQPKEETKEEVKEEPKEDDPYYSESSSEPDNSEPAPSAASSYVLDTAEAARQATREAEEKVTRSQNKLNELESWLNGDYGADLEFAELADQCFTLNEKQYVYEICVFKEAHQREGGSSTSLGRWSGIRKPDADHEYTRFAFENGAGCWQGPSRSLEVNLICGINNELKSVDEPSRCVYTMMMTTPSVCSAERAEMLKKRLADQTETTDE